MVHKPKPCAGLVLLVIIPSEWQSSSQVSVAPCQGTQSLSAYLKPFLFTPSFTAWKERTCCCAFLTYPLPPPSRQSHKACQISACFEVRVLWWGEVRWYPSGQGSAGLWCLLGVACCSVLAQGSLFFCLTHIMRNRRKIKNWIFSPWTNCLGVSFIFSGIDEKPVIF